MKGTTGIAIKWDSEQRAFVVLSDESLADQFSELELEFKFKHQNLTLNRKEDAKQTTEDQELAELFDKFRDCWGTHDFFTSMTKMQTLRTQLLTKILATTTPLRWLPKFLLNWQSVLKSVRSSKMQLSSRDLVDYILELTALARGWELVGDIFQARSCLVICFEMSRQHFKTAFEKDNLTENDALRQTIAAAKHLLLECVAFQTSFARNKELIERHEAPPHILASLSKEFWSLLRVAPLSVEVAILLTYSLMKQRQFSLVVRFFEYSSFTENAELALLYGKALAYMGFYRHSIQIAESFTLPRSKDKKTSLVALRDHCDCLKKLIKCRTAADELLRMEQFEKAAISYKNCLTLLDPVDEKQTTALLFSHANALLGLEKNSEAILEFQKSLQLDPTNSIASFRLQTASMQLETERIKNELSRKR